MENAMKVYKRGNVWWIRFTKDGKEHRISCETKSKKEAQAFAERMHMASRAGSRAAALAIVDAFYPPERPSGVLLSEAWKRYVDVLKSTGKDQSSKRTMDYRRQTLARFIDWASDAAPMVKSCEEVDGPIAAAFAAHLATVVSKQTKKPLSAKSRANAILEMSNVWKMLGKVSSAISDPWNGLAPRADKSSRRPAFSREQETAIMEAAEKIGKGWLLACLIARHTGLRYGDVANLEWADIDMGARTIGHADDEYVVKKTKRHGISVLLPLADPVYDALNEVPADRRTGFVLPNHAALYGRYSESVYKQLNFREVLDAAGVGPEWDFHSWRHTFRSRLGEAGVDIETAKRLCGHTRDETSRHYDHASHIGEYRSAVDAAAKV